MRRKQKFKEKERRREMNEFIREQYRNKPQIDPLQHHDFAAINELKTEQTKKALGINSDDNPQR